MASAPKIVVRGKEARIKIKEGVDFCADIVKATLGPSGKNALLERQGKWPAVINDGIRIARKVTMNEKKNKEVQDATITTLVNACHKTNEAAGDGTTTSIVLAQKIVEVCFKKIDEAESEILGSKLNVIALKKEVMKWTEKVIEELKAMAKPVNTKEDLVNVATASSESVELGEKIADMVWRIGKEGFITVEETLNPTTEWKVVEGLYFYGRYAAPFMRNVNERDEVMYEANSDKLVPILVTNQDILEGNSFLRRVNSDESIIKDLAQKGYKQMVIIAPKFGDSALVGLLSLRKLGFNVLAVQAKSLTSEQMEDIAVYTGGTFYNFGNGLSIDKATVDTLGFAQKVISGNDKTAVIGGAGKPEAVKERIDKLKGELESEEDHTMFRKKLERRIGALSGGVGLIRVGSETDIEGEYLLRKLEDAANATKAAYQEGVVPGGGIALKNIAEKLPENILTEVLKAPYEQIQKNAGGSQEIPEWVVDPVKVTRIALLNAASVASNLITVDTVIVGKQRSLIDDIQTQIILDPRFKDPLPPRVAEQYEPGWQPSEY